MNKQALLAMVTRKGTTLASGFCLGVWAALTYPELATPDNLLLLVGLVLGAASVKLSADNEKARPRGNPAPES